MAKIWRRFNFKNKDFQRAYNKAALRTEYIVRESLIELGQSVVDASPVWQNTGGWFDHPGGAFRGNWQLATSVNVTFSAAKLTKPNIRQQMNKIDIRGGDVYLVNPTPYGDIIEYGLFDELFVVPTRNITEQGYSRQAPTGVIRIKSMEWGNIAARKAREAQAIN